MSDAIDYKTIIYDFINSFSDTSLSSLSDDELIEKCRKGDKAAQTALYLNNYMQINRMAQRLNSTLFSSAVLDDDDFNIVGAMELLNSIQRYDSEKGAKFSTYLYKCIHGAMIRELQNKGYTISIPVNESETMRKVSDRFQELSSSNSENECLNLISNELNISIEKIKDYRKLYQNIANLESLQYIIENDSSTTSSDNLANEDLLENVSYQDELHEKLDEVLRTLTHREEEVIRERYGMNDGIGKTQEEVGIILGISTQRVGQLEANALAKLQHPSRSKKLKDFYK